MRMRSGISMAVKLIFILSLCVMVYSAFQIFKAPAEAREALKTWEKKREEALPPGTAALIQEEEHPLPAGMISDPAGPASTATAYTEGEVIGEIYFPKLDRRVAILEGTGRAALKKGAGHDEASAVIGTSGNSVLAGHRDTVFRNLGDLKINDFIELETTDGKFTYEVTGSTIVDGEARGVIKRGKEPVLTLITCYPFSYVGSAPDRYLLSARLIASEPLAGQP